MRHQAHPPEQEEQGDRAQRVGGQADDGVAHGRRRVLAREVGRREHLDEDEGGKAEGEDGERIGGGRGVGGRERAALEQRLHDGDGRHRQRNGRRHRQQHGELQRPVLAVHHGGMVAGAQLARHVREQHDADGDADDGERQLVDPVRVVEVRDGARLQRGDHRADHDVDLRHATGHHARQPERDEPAHTLGHARAAQAQRQAVAARAVEQQQELEDAGGEHAPRLDHAGERLIAEAQPDGHPRGAHHREVEDDGDCRALHELSHRVEHAGEQRHDRHAQQVGHGDAGEQHRQVEFLRARAEARRQAEHEERHGDLGQRRQEDEHEDETGQRLLCKHARGVAAFALQAPGEQRDERGVERALAEQAAEEVGKSERHKERVGHRAGAEGGRDQDVAGKAQHAAHHGQAADGGEGAIELHGPSPSPTPRQEQGGCAGAAATLARSRALQPQALFARRGKCARLPRRQQGRGWAGDVSNRRRQLGAQVAAGRDLRADCAQRAVLPG